MQACARSCRTPLPDGVAVLRRIGKHLFHTSPFQVLQQRLSLRSIAALSGGDQQFQQLSPSIPGCVQFGRQSSPDAPQAARPVGIRFLSPA